MQSKIGVLGRRPCSSTVWLGEYEGPALPDEDEGSEAMDADEGPALLDESMSCKDVLAGPRSCHHELYQQHLQEI
jgi:hypothetical protein